MIIQVTLKITLVFKDKNNSKVLESAFQKFLLLIPIYRHLLPALK